MNNPSRYTDPSGHTAVDCGEADSGCGGSVGSGNPDNGSNNNDPDIIDHHHGHQNNSIRILADPPNPSIYTLVPLAILFSVATAVVELAIVGGEMAMAPVDAAMPIVGIPLSLTLAAAGAIVLDLDVAFVVYTARVAEHPEVHQEIEFSPLKLWGLKK